MPIDHETATCRLGVGNRTHYYAEKRRQNELLTYMNQHIFHDIMIATKATRTAPQNVITIVTAFYTGNAPPPLSRPKNTTMHYLCIGLETKLLSTVSTDNVRFVVHLYLHT